MIEWTLKFFASVFLLRKITHSSNRIHTVVSVHWKLPNTNTESMIYGTSIHPDTERITDSIIINFWSSHICEQVKSQEIFSNCLFVRRGGVLVCAHTTKRVLRNKLTNKQTKTTIRQRSKYIHVHTHNRIRAHTNPIIQIGF